MSYGVKKHVHIGVDVVISHLSKPARKIFALLSIAACLTFAVLLMIGAWKYWYPFATERAWMETEDLPMPQMLQFLADWMNEGERYEKVPRWIPYLALPLGVGLLLIRLLQQGWRIISGEIDMIIASHEAEELLEELEMEAPHPAGSSMRTGKEG
jgi:C4-dicarboxylate transporter DctQ subunit